MKTQRYAAAVFTFGALGLPLLFAVPASAQENAEELYQAGLYQEEMKGNLKRKTWSRP